MAQILPFPKKSVLHSSKITFPPLKGLRISQALGGTNDLVPVEVEKTRPWDMSKVIESGVDLTKFSDDDYIYNPNLDVIFVSIGSPLYTWLSLLK